MQTDVIRDTGRTWDFLEPAMVPNQARTDHIVLLAPAAGLFTNYRRGQIVRQKDDGTNSWAKIGTAGYTGPPRILKYSYLVKDDGKYQMTESATWNPSAQVWDSGSVDAYYQGFFKTQDLIGAGGTNEVQTLTMDANVDGGTYKLTLAGYTTAPIAWNAVAATIKAALIAAVPLLTSADITVAGLSPYSFAFIGAWAGTNIPPMTVDVTGLRDGGLVMTTNTTAMSTGTEGAPAIAGIGRLVRGTASTGILELGAATPV